MKDIYAELGESDLDFLIALDANTRVLAADADPRHHDLQKRLRRAERRYNRAISVQDWLSYRGARLFRRLGPICAGYIAAVEICIYNPAYSLYNRRRSAIVKTYESRRPNLPPR